MRYLIVAGILLVASCATSQGSMKKGKYTLHYQYAPAIEELGVRINDGYRGGRLRLAIPAFANSDGQRSELGREVADSLHQHLFTGRKFVLLERARIDSLLKEHELQQQGLVQTSADVGSKLGADLVLVGTISHDSNSFSLNARVVQFGSGEVKAVAKSVVYATSRLYAKYQKVQ